MCKCLLETGDTGTTGNPLLTIATLKKKLRRVDDKIRHCVSLCRCVADDPEEVVAFLYIYIYVNILPTNFKSYFYFRKDPGFQDPQ
jgi:hypothetical protein